MHEIVFLGAALWMAVLLSISLLTVVRARSSLTRVLALDMGDVVADRAVDLYSTAQRWAITSMRRWCWRCCPLLPPIAAARYHSEGEIF